MWTQEALGRGEGLRGAVAGADNRFGPRDSVAPAASSVRGWACERVAAGFQQYNPSQCLRATGDDLPQQGMRSASRGTTLGCRPFQALGLRGTVEGGGAPL